MRVVISKMRPIGNCVNKAPILLVLAVLLALEMHEGEDEEENEDEDSPVSGR
jgi:hypothetical protein